MYVRIRHNDHDNVLVLVYMMLTLFLTCGRLIRPSSVSLTNSFPRSWHKKAILTRIRDSGSEVIAWHLEWSLSHGRKFPTIQVCVREKSRETAGKHIWSMKSSCIHGMLPLTTTLFNKKKSRNGSANITQVFLFFMHNFFFLLLTLTEILVLQKTISLLFTAILSQESTPQQICHVLRGQEEHSLAERDQRGQWILVPGSGRIIIQMRKQDEETKTR